MVHEEKSKKEIFLDATQLDYRKVPMLTNIGVEISMHI